MHIYDLILILCIFSGGLSTEDATSTQGVIDEEDGKRYCTCNGISYGKMVNCDNPDVSLSFNALLYL